MPPAPTPEPFPDRPDGVRSGESCVEAKNNLLGVNAALVVPAPILRTGVRMFGSASGSVSAVEVEAKMAAGGGSK